MIISLYLLLSVFFFPSNLLSLLRHHCKLTNVTAFIALLQSQLLRDAFATKCQEKSPLWPDPPEDWGGHLLRPFCKYKHVKYFEVSSVQYFLHKEGGHVALSDVLKDVCRETAKELASVYGEERVFWRECDVTSKESFERLYDETERHFEKKVTLVVNNAGVNHTVGWRKCMDVDIVIWSTVTDRFAIHSYRSGSWLVLTWQWREWAREMEEAEVTSSTFLQLQVKKANHFFYYRLILK